MLNTPVLFLVFNRPDTTAKVFDTIRQVQPARLFIAADGPRPGKEGEAELCKQVRELILNGINWNCEVQTLFRNENLGCGRAVSGAISWFFEQVEEGIILEDDCLPDSSFFPFCAELLEKYRDDQRVMSISGSNLLGKAWKEDMHSYFWGITGIWGWATWRRSWKFYDFKMSEWENPEIKNRISNALRSRAWFEFYYGMFDSTFNGTLDTWDVQWLYTILINGGLAVNPSVNLVRNIGFGDLATNTFDKNNPIALLKTNTIEFPLRHPSHFITDVDYLDRMLFNIRPEQKQTTKLFNVLETVKRLKRVALRLKNKL